MRSQGYISDDIFLALEEYMAQWGDALQVNKPLGCRVINPAHWGKALGAMGAQRMGSPSCHEELGGPARGGDTYLW